MVKPRGRNALPSCHLQNLQRCYVPSVEVTYDDLGVARFLKEVDILAIDYANIGERIRYNRIKNKMSQERLAELAAISSVHIGYLERGERVPSLETIINVANALNVSADELLAGSLIVSSVQRNPDDFTVLFDCSKEEYSIILQCMKGIKSILRGYRITK